LRESAFTVNDGAASFANVTTYDIGDWGWFTEIADVGGDGDLDIIAVTKQAKRSVAVLLNDANGQFTLGPVTDLSLSCEDIALGDFDGDGDGDFDVVVPINKSDDIHVLVSDGQGVLSTALVISTTREFYTGAGGDMNGDGSGDLFT
jgi:hypothetical protein